MEINQAYFQLIYAVDANYARETKGLISTADDKIDKKEQFLNIRSISKLDC